MKLRKNGLCLPSLPCGQACLWSLGLAAGLLLVILTWWLINRLSEE